MNFHHENYTRKAPKIRDFKVFFGYRPLVFFNSLFYIVKKRHKKRAVGKNSSFSFSRRIQAY